MWVLRLFSVVTADVSLIICVKYLNWLLNLAYIEPLTSAMKNYSIHISNIILPVVINIQILILQYKRVIMSNTISLEMRSLYSQSDCFSSRNFHSPDTVGADFVFTEEVSGCQPHLAIN